MTRSHVTAAVFKQGARFLDTSSQTLLNKDWQCCESWRDAELGVRAVCAVGDTTDEDRWVDLLCCSPHRDAAESCLTNDTLTTFSVSSDCYDDWRRHRLLSTRPTTPGVCSVGVAVATTRLLLSTCCLPLATSFWWHFRFYTMVLFAPCFTSVFP